MHLYLLNVSEIPIILDRILAKQYKDTLIDEEFFINNINSRILESLEEYFESSEIDKEDDIMCLIDHIDKGILKDPYAKDLKTKTYVVTLIDFDGDILVKEVENIYG